MTNISSFDFPPPSDWQAFERLIRDLFEREWETADAQANGRSGQKQAGVDVYGTDRRHSKWVGIQCKGRTGGYSGKVTEKELRDEVEKAKGFVPKLDKFILATTAPNDANIQKVARELNEKHRENHLFEVAVLSWDEIKAYLDRHPQVSRGHLSGVSGLAQSVLMDVVTEAFAAVSRPMNDVAQPREISATSATAPERNFSDDLLGQRITDAADLLNDSTAQAAIARLTKLLEKEGSNATNRNRFRIMANLGSAHAAKGDTAVAVDWYRQAYEEYPETAEGLSILAAAEALDGNHEEAVNIAHRALALPNPQDRAVAVLLECTPSDIPWKQLQSQIPQQFQNKPEFLLILAERAQIAGEHKDYHKLVKEAVRRDPQGWRVLSYAGYLRFREVIGQNQSLALGVLRTQDIELLTTAQTHFIAAWGSLKDSGYQSEAETTLINAISVSLLLRDGAALNDLIRVASGRLGDVTQLLRLRAATHIQRGEHGIAADILATIPVADRSPDDELLHLQAQINDGRSAEAL